MTHGPAIKPERLAGAELNRHASIREYATFRFCSRCFSDAPMKALNSGCGSSGFDLNSGWNWQPRYQG